VAGIRGEIHHDVAVLAWLLAFGKIEIQRIALPKTRERLFERGGVIDGHTVAAGIARDLRRAGRLGVRSTPSARVPIAATTAAAEDYAAEPSAKTATAETAAAQSSSSATAIAILPGIGCD
jgi:hypothetical protein